MIVFKLYFLLQTTISEIQQQMQENHDRNKQLREENYELANKLKKFIEQYEAREKVGVNCSIGIDSFSENSF